MESKSQSSKITRGAVVPHTGKTRITIYLDDFVVEEFRNRADAAGKGYQTLINEILRQHVSPNHNDLHETLRKVIREEIEGAIEGKLQQKPTCDVMGESQYLHEETLAEKLPELLDSVITRPLNERGIYDIGNYGWLSEDAVDPDYFGHAIWQSNPPFETEWESLFGEEPVRNRPTQKQKLLTVAGHDFEGLMRASRLSIGLALLHHATAQKYPLRENHYFWLHQTDAILKLNMASDRIRDYFNIAFFYESSNWFHHKTIRGGLYASPFKEVQEVCQQHCAGKRIAYATNALPSLATQIYSFRKLRNAIVHDIATKVGKLNLDLVENQQQAYDEKKITSCTNVNFEELKEHQEELEKVYKSRLDDSVNVMIDWYDTLIKCSNYVFEAEYWLRKDVIAPEKSKS